MFRQARVHRPRQATSGGQSILDNGGTRPNKMLLLLLIPVLINVLLACLQVSKTEYSIERENTYQSTN